MAGWLPIMAGISDGWAVAGGWSGELIPEVETGDRRWLPARAVALRGVSVIVLQARP